MRKTEIIVGSVILGFGFLFLIGSLFDFNIWGLICPAGLIGLGVFLMYRTNKNPSDGDIKIRFVGDIRRQGVWEAHDDETWGFVIDSKFDFTDAKLPDGMTTFQISAFVSDFKIVVPADLGVSIYSMAFMTESRVFGEKQETFFIPFSWESDNFKTANKKIILKPTCFVSEIRVDLVKNEA
jgi:predicted membrane protein